MKVLKRIIQQIKASCNKHNISEGITPQHIINKLQSHFKEVIDEMSTTETLVFPMTFAIYLYPEDHNKINPYFQAFSSEIINKFYNIIRNNHKKGRKLTDYHAKSWNIYITAAESVELGNKRFNLQKGDIKIWSSAFDIVDDKDKKRNISFRAEDNKLININIDPTSLVNITLDGHIQVEWKNPLKESLQIVSDTICPKTQSNIRMARGELRYKIPGGRTYKFSILYDLCQISGEKDTREDASIFKIKSPKIETKHAEIKYDAQSNEFKLAAYYQTSINNKEVPLSNGGNIKWTQHPDNANIKVANIIIVNFKKLI